jgi:hypothetical protein
MEMHKGQDCACYIRRRFWQRGEIQAGFVREPV